MPTLGAKREAVIHFKLHNALSNVIQRVPRFDGFAPARTEPEYPIPGVGEADLVLYDRDDVSWLTIETKASTKEGDPFSDKVIGQAVKYAAALGSYYFATCDGRTFVLFDNKEKGVPFWERKRLPPYDIEGKDLEAFAERLLRDLAQLEAGMLRWSALDEAFVARLKFLHARFAPPLYESLRQKLRKDGKFRTRYERWLEEQGFEPEDATYVKTAVEAAYLLINKILFYKVLEPHYGLKKLKRIEDGADVTKALRQAFQKVLSIDYEAVFEPSIYDEIPLPDEMASIVNNFLDESAKYDLSKFESDVLGRIYEGLIPREERRVLGQYYTPPPICDLIVRMCVHRPGDLVLDPGCGSGGFLVKAYYQLLRLRGGSLEPDSATHRQLLRQLWGVDISHFPAHLAVINLALRKIEAKTRVVKVLPRDFFKVLPAQKTLLPILLESLGDRKGIEKIVPRFDAVVCNPPYTRQDEVGDDKYRQFIRKVALRFDGKVELSNEAGLYAYFFTHSSHFLKEGGMMGYIVSNSWMDVKFGVVLQRFFLDNFVIRSILEFDHRAFEEAAINTVIVTLQKATGDRRKEERDGNVVKFVRIKQPMTTDGIVSRIAEASITRDADEVKVYLVRQADLYKDTKWLKYLRSPTAYFDLLAHPRIVRLAKVADVNVGIITYANQFFILTRDGARNQGIEDEFLRPIITSPRDVKFYDLRSDEIPEILFYVNRPKPAVTGTGALGYIQWGESVRVEITRGKTRGTFVKGFNNVPSLRGKPMWYSVGPSEPAPILFPRLMWERLFVIRNSAQSLSNDRFYEVRPHKAEDEKVLLAYLNSVVGRFAMEVCGRSTLGEGGLELMKYELDDFPVLDPETLTPDERATMADAYDALERSGRGSDAAALDRAKAELDTIVIAALGLGQESADAIRRGSQDLQDLRQARVDVDVLVEHPEKKAIRPKRKREKKVANPRSPTRSLDEFAS